MRERREYYGGERKREVGMGEEGVIREKGRWEVRQGRDTREGDKGRGRGGGAPYSWVSAVSWPIESGMAPDRLLSYNCLHAQQANKHGTQHETHAEGREDEGANIMGGKERRWEWGKDGVIRGERGKWG